MAAATAIDSRSCDRFIISVDEAGALLAEQVRLRHLDVVEEQLGGVLGVLADLVEVAAALEALHAALDDEQADALVAGVGVGAATTTITRSDRMPLEMNVFWPLST